MRRMRFFLHQPSKLRVALITGLPSSPIALASLCPSLSSCVRLTEYRSKLVPSGDFSDGLGRMQVVLTALPLNLNVMDGMPVREPSVF
jgi:hypothetical protein